MFGPQQISFGEVALLFICQEHYFSLLSFNECSLFLLLRLVFIFRLVFCSDIIISLHQGVFLPLVHIGIHQKSCFKKVRMVLENRKSFMQKKWDKKELV
jgi:hypothetical protein